MPLIHYRSFSVHTGSDSENFSELFKSISEKEKILTISLFGKVREEEYLSKVKTIRQTALEILGRIPLISFIAQTPEDENSLIAEVGYLTDSISMSDVNFHESVKGSFATIHTKEFFALIIEGLMADDTLKPIGNQSVSIFENLKEILNFNSMPIGKILRQWNYIGDITGIKNHRQNYQEFNNARADFYSSAEWETGYPAATGISMDIPKVIVSLIAIDYHNHSTVYPLNNSQQLAAHVYSTRLLGESDCKQTPKFERAKLISNGSSVCYISGTAAIKGQESENFGDVKGQTLQTIGLIRNLISKENLSVNGVNVADELKLKNLRVYVKKPQDFEAIHQVVETELPGIDTFYVCAGVCREELLVEIEGMATT